MATLDWPPLPAFVPREFTWGLRVPKARFTGFFTSNSQSLSHLADRLVASLVLRPCNPEQAGAREAFFFELLSAGHDVRLSHQVRPEPTGTLRGSPTVGASAAAGARTITVQTVAGATLLAGDVLGVGSQLLPVGYAGAVANGSGVMSVPLQLPLRLPLTAGSAAIWQAPTGRFELLAASLDMSYGKGLWQRGFTVDFLEKP